MKENLIFRCFLGLGHVKTQTYFHLINSEKSHWLDHLLKPEQNKAI